MTPWKTEKLAILDTETTGLDPDNCRIVELAVAKVQDGKLLSAHNQLLNPGVPVPEMITNLTGITTEMVSNKPSFKDVAKKFLEQTEGYTFVAYNAHFDANFVRAEMLRNGLGREDHSLYSTWIDPLVWIRKFDKFVRGQGRHKLVKACERRGIMLPENIKAHRAAADVWLTTRLLLAMMKELPDDLDELVVIQHKLNHAQEQDYVRYKAAANNGL